MKKTFKYIGGILLIILFLVGTVSMFTPNDDIIHFRVTKIYTIGVNIKCYELIPSGKYNNLTRIIMYGDPGIPLQIDQQVDLNIIKK